MTAGAVIAILTVAGAALLVLPDSGPATLHDYADRRDWFGIPNGGDVVSNIAFVIVGSWGLWRLRGSGTAITTRPLTAFFVAVILVGPGSAYYHWAPTTATLAWDRLPMAIAFMALLTAFVADRIDAVVARRLLWPLAVTGAASVVVWRASGVIWPYALVQLAPIVAALVLCASAARPGALFSRVTLVGLLMFYGLAKASEEADVALWRALGENVSGHTLKHLLAAGAAAVVARTAPQDLKRRT